MDLRRAPSGNKVSVTITSALVSAFLEWMLMFMIFVHACFSYLLTTFARHCQLQIPCLLCSRLDHVLANQKPSYHLDLFCRNHKLDISSLVLCQIHDNLVDVRGTCETCLFSFATINKSNAETYRLLVGKLGAEPHNGLAQGASSDSRKCTCCNEEWVSKTSSGNLFRSKLIGSEVSDHDATPSITLKFTGDEMQGIIERSMPNKNADLLPHVEYKQIKVYSDTESESPSSDAQSVNALILEMESSVQDSTAKSVKSGPQIIADADFPSLEELINQDPPIESSVSESGATLGHGLEELNWQQAHHSKDVSEPSELISFTEELPANGIHEDEAKETNATSTLDATSTTRLEEEVHDECGEVSHRGIDSAGTGELWKEVTMDCGEISRAGNDSATVNETQMNMKSSTTGNSSQMAGSLDLGDAYRLALGTRSRQLSGKLLEQQRSMNELTRVSEDFKLLLSQISAARGFELSSNDISPRVSANTEDFKAVDAYGAIGMQMIQRRISLERNESNLSLDGTTISEIEGESAVDRLRRQVEHDKKIMGTLYKELEEEKNASAVAVNQAMAMITRLQEEKAALHMEALQCLRMMEEQAEYDGEALQNATDLLTEKEKHIQDIEFELESYRNQLGDVSMSNTFIKTRPESDAGELNAHKLETNDNNSDNDKNDIDTQRISLGLEDEKQYILECLEKLEAKLLTFAKLEPNPRMIDGALSTEEVPEASASDQVDCMGVSQENGGTERNHLQGYELTAKEPPKDLSGHENSQREIHHFSADAKLEALRHELSMMKNRLEALEAEQKLIDCSINSLRAGSEGLEFIREIAVPLQELHSALIITRYGNLTQMSVSQC